MVVVVSMVVPLLIWQQLWSELANGFALALHAI
jgi:hypothetical protein